MNYKQALELDQKHVFQTYKRRPLLFVRGRGVYVYDDAGQRYLDLLGGLAVNALGHAHPRLAAAIAGQARTLGHTSNLYLTEPMLTLAQRLCTLSGMDRVFFGNSGAEANEAAIKIARRYFHAVKKENRFEIITLKHSFHGRTLATITATGQPFYQQGFEPLVPGFKYAERYDIASVEKLITPRTAAVMVEPVQGESGVYPATRAFMRGLASLRKKHGVLLIFDEVQCGLGRTGKWFAFEHYGVRPDIMTLAKPLGGGVPLGAMLARGDAAAGFAAGSHASTFGANPIACAAANAFIDAVEENHLLDNVNRMGDYLKKKIEDLASETGKITGIRVMGLMIGIDITESAPTALDFMQDNGILVNAVGEHTIRILPPFIITEKHADVFLKTLKTFLVASSR